jgi:ribosomal protein S18 acetylase RimI-like enzyme
LCYPTFDAERLRKAAAAAHARIAAMIGEDIEHQLDNPIWSSLTTRHTHLALGDGLARRYPSAISPLTGLSQTARENVARLDTLVESGDDFGIFGATVPKLGSNWETLKESRITQMIRVDPSALPEGDIEVSALDASDVADMLELVELTQPGPFRPRTIELGTYIGVRENGRLVAMAGERMWIGDCREVSAICTHPDAQGRGYARALTGRVVNRMLRAGQTPFLHVYSTNTRAIEVYEALGFVRRTEFSLLHARRIG